MWCYGICVYGLAWITGLGAFTLSNLPAGISLWSYLAFMATVGRRVSVLTAAGEEIGWRRLLVSQLFRVTDFTQTALISSAIWVAWHMPLLLFANYNAGMPWWFASICFTVGGLGASFAFAWLRLKSDNVWKAIILHASYNLFIQQFFDILTANTGITLFITTEFGLGVALGFSVIVCLRKRGPDHRGIVHAQDSLEKIMNIAQLQRDAPL
jgi:uncharacterized protein